MKRITSFLFFILTIGVITPPLYAQNSIFHCAPQIGGTNSDFGNSITTDVNGNVFSSGSFPGIADFDPGAGTTDLTSIGNQDISIQKLSKSTLGLAKNSLSDNFVVYPNPTDGKFSIEFENTHKTLTERLLSIRTSNRDTQVPKHA